ncbi:hypothetical protein [Sediminimonas qiaohouensis]|uniref:hypothetical protein n=1 Tax=Sediminimonas qiaohouensis TaxID=552061 RepID=UPI0004281561|nr:hypothetical protein [Sediminimonas qiaohouensis]
MLLGVLQWIARHGRLVLVAGLLAGLALPGLAEMLRDWLAQMVAVLLFLTAMRIGARAALGSLAQAGGALGASLVMQLALPLAAVAGFAAFGVLQTPMALALVLMLAAPPVAGVPSFTLMMGHDPAPGLRLLIVGTALLPLTVLPVLWALPTLGSAAGVLAAAGRLLLVIAAATVAGFALRAALPRTADRRAIEALDGLTALALAVIVIGLMSAVAPALASDPMLVLWWFCVAVAANLGLQLLAYMVLGARGVATSVAAGNRSIALFLVALPPDMMAPLLLFIGCYQLPMFLTPIIMKRVYRGRHVTA